MNDSNPINFQISDSWRYPCGRDIGCLTEEPVDIPADIHYTNKDTLKRVVVLADKALKELEWKDSWTQENFGKDFQAHYVDIKNHLDPHQYLPSFTETKKSLGEPIPKDILEKLVMIETMQNTYQWLERVAVGMEQLIYDQFKYHEKYATNFNNAYHSLKAILCELKEAMSVLHIKKSKDVNQNDMPDEDRKLNNQIDRKVRDWTIFVTYIDLLEYIHQAYEHLAEKEQ